MKLANINDNDDNLGADSEFKSPELSFDVNEVELLVILTYTLYLCLCFHLFV